MEEDEESGSNFQRSTTAKKPKTKFETVWPSSDDDFGMVERPSTSGTRKRATKRSRSTVVEKKPEAKVKAMCREVPARPIYIVQEREELHRQVAQKHAGNPYYDGTLRQDSDVEYRVKHVDMRAPVLDRLHYLVNVTDGSIWYKVPAWLNENTVSEMSGLLSAEQLTHKNLIPLTKLAIYTNNGAAIFHITASMILTSLVFPALRFNSSDILKENAVDMFTDPTRTNLLVQMACTTVGVYKFKFLQYEIADLLVFWSPLLHDLFVKKPQEIARWMSRIPFTVVDQMLWRKERGAGRKEDVNRFAVLWTASHRQDMVDVTRVGVLLDSSWFSPYLVGDPEHAVAIQNLRTTDEIKDLLKQSSRSTNCLPKFQRSYSTCIVTVLPKGDAYLMDWLTEATKMVIAPSRPAEAEGVLACCGERGIYICTEGSFFVAECTTASLKSNAIAAWRVLSELPRACRRRGTQMFCFFDRLLMFVGGRHTRGAPAEVMDLLGEDSQRSETERYAFVYDMKRDRWHKFYTAYRWFWSVTCKYKCAENTVELLTCGKVLAAVPDAKTTFVRYCVDVKDLLSDDEEVPGRLIESVMTDNFLPKNDRVTEGSSMIYCEKTDAVTVVCGETVFKHAGGDWTSKPNRTAFIDRPFLYDTVDDMPRIIGALDRITNKWNCTKPMKLDENLHFAAGTQPPSSEMIQQSLRTGFSSIFPQVCTADHVPDDGNDLRSPLWPPCAILPLKLNHNCDAWIRRG